MPQVYNKALAMDQDSSVFNSSSRYMASLRFSDASVKRANVLNSLEKRIGDIKTSYINKDSGITLMKMNRVKERLMNNFHKRLAYKLVLKHHSIEHATDYAKALDRRYTYESMQNEIRLMMIKIKPEAVRKQKARFLVAANRKRYDEALKKNWDEIEKRFPVKKWRSYGLPIQETTQIKEPETPLLPPIEDRNKRGLATLRRRIITIDDSKPSSPIKTPGISKPPSSSSVGMGKRQGITMNMMKKQKSFLETTEKTDLSDSYKIKEIVEPIVESGQETSSARDKTQQKDIDMITIGADRVSDDIENITELTNKLTVLPAINRNQSATDKPSEYNGPKKLKRLSIGEGSKMKLPALKLSVK